MESSAMTILLVDDDQIDAMAMQRAFKSLGIDRRVIVAENGIEALERLRGENGFDRIEPPCLIVLDLNMPCMGGLEFLEELRADPALRRLVVFVMSTSDAPEDRNGAYDKNVAGYVLKYRPGEEYTQSLRMLELYCRVVEFPSAPIVSIASAA